MSNPLTYEMLRQAVDGGSVALRSTLRLQPVDGPGGKVFPPTYLRDGRGSKYAFEPLLDKDREIKRTVLLDSVASQANRAEQALRDAWEDDKLVFPVPYVDFTGEIGDGDEEDLSHFGKITVLDAPHRLADAIFRDSELDGISFQDSDIGREVFKANPRNATAMYRHAPTALLFGQWNSTGPKDRPSEKFQRVYVSEIVGKDAKLGVKVSSRIDPLGIETVDIYSHEDSREKWTLTKKNGRKKIKPSEIGHGNIAPSIDTDAGGVTISEAVQMAVISLAGLRRLRFPGEDKVVIHTALAALGVAAMTFGLEADFDLRSRCLLVPLEPQTIELVARDGSEAEQVSVDCKMAALLLEEATKEAEKAGIGWSIDSMVLKPSQKFVDLLKLSASRSVESAGSGDLNEG